MNKRGYVGYLIVISLLLVIALIGFVYTGRVTTDNKFCSDSDFGKSIHTKGTCSSARNTLRDGCTSLTNLYEAFCTSDINGQFCIREGINCPTDYYCYNGACINRQSNFACYNVTDCNDKNPCTIDLCNFPGTNQSWCLNRKIDGCSINVK